MKFKGLSKVHAGKFIDRYDIVYETADGNEKVYEMISRDHDIDKVEDIEFGFYMVNQENFESSINETFAISVK